MNEPASHVEVQPAATVMLVRDGSTEGPGSLEVLMLRRHPDSAFAADAWVFPGGRVDDSDRVVPAGFIGPSEAEADAALGLGSGGRAWYVAAARECFEEAGILLARHSSTGAWLDTTTGWDAARLARYRRGVHSGALSLTAVLEAEGLALDLSGVHYVSHWITPPGNTLRRFDTRFFVAVAPPQQTAAHDAAETVETLWTTPADVLARHAAGEIFIVIPTIHNLRSLARFPTTTDLEAAARAVGPVPLAAPRFRGDPTVPAAVLSPTGLAPGPAPVPDNDPECPCPT